MLKAVTIRIGLVAAFIAALVVGLPKASAAWLYEPPDPGPGLLGITIPGADQTISKATPIWVNQVFAFKSDVLLDTIGAAMTIGSDPNYAGYKISLVTNPYDIAGTTLWSGVLHPAGASRAYVDLSFSPIYLKANKAYALVFAPGDGMVYGGLALVWPYQGQYDGAFRIACSPDQGTTWNYNYNAYYPSAFRLGGVVVPEPASLVALAMGLACLGRCRARRS